MVDASLVVIHQDQVVASYLLEEETCQDEEVMLQPLVDHAAKRQLYKINNT
jgi:hypothetical protein